MHGWTGEGGVTLTREEYAQPWRLMQEIDTLLMKAIPWSERLEQVVHSLLRLFDSDAIWLVTAPPVGGIACGIIRSPISCDPQACVIFTDLAPPPLFDNSDSPLVQVLEAGVPRMVSELSSIDGHLDNDLADALLHTLEVHPSLIVPLLIGTEPVGVLVVADHADPSHALSAEILQVIGGHLGVTLQSAYLRDASRRQVEALATLNRIAQTITSSLDIDEVIRHTMAGINEILDVEAGSLLLIDEETKELYFKITLRGEHKRLTSFRLQPGQGIAGWVVTHGTPTLANDASTDPRFYSKIDEAIGFKTRSVLCAPLIVQGRPIGALEVINKRRGYFTVGDQQLLTSMCASLAIAFENAILYQKAQERAQRTVIINDITTAINTSLSLPEATQAIAMHLHRLIPFDHASICLLDDNSRQLHVYHLTRKTARGHPRPIPIPFEGSGLEWIVQQNRPQLTDLTATEKLNLDTAIIPDSDMSQLISAPLVAQQKVRGVINLTSVQRGTYSSTHVDILEQIAPQLTIAIEKAHLFDLMERRTAELQTLNRMGERLFSTTETARILSIALAFIPHLVPGDVHALLLMGEDGGYWGINLPFAASESLLDHVSEEMTSTLAPLLETDDITLVRRKVIAGQKPMPADWEPIASLTLPIITRLGCLGVAHLASSRTEDFEGDALRVFSLLSSQIAAAVENAHLFREVEKERARLEAFLSSTTEPLIVVDRSLHIVLANPAARRVFAPDQEWDNQLLPEVVQNETLLELFSKAQRSESTFGEIPLPDGRTFHASISPIAGSEVHTAGWVAAMQDVTYLKDLDQMKTDFINAVSHDLRSPLSGILIATHLVGQTGQLNEQQEEFLHTIDQRVGAMTELIDDLLDSARVEAGIDMEVEPCVMGPLITQVVKQLEEQIHDKSLQIEIVAGSNLPPVLGNARRLRQVLSNLINNAIKYTPKGKRIGITTSHNQGEILVSIEDEGIGIPAADQVHIFDKFYRVDRPETANIKGTGLGLAITRSIIEKLGGRIWVESELNVGSTFTFALPTIPKSSD
jgi:signal transduction histidine kinase/putative methionine-R-sulfoxide reductase with GAF domain